jgi:hypothetical protein
MRRKRPAAYAEIVKNDDRSGRIAKLVKIDCLDGEAIAAISRLSGGHW